MADRPARKPLPAAYDESRCLVVSSSQKDTYDLCRRKWWFDKVGRLPDPPRDFLEFGTTLHGVLERYLAGDDNGRNPDGTPVDLYPPGWAGGLPPQAADLIQKLVAAAIQRGHIVKHPQRVIEAGFIRHLADVAGSAASPQGWSIFVTGFIDVLTPTGIEDHKTTSKIEYAKSENALQKNGQMLLYAAELMWQAAEAGIDLQEVTVAHNVFVRNVEKPATRKTGPVPVTREAVVAHWRELQQTAIEMLGDKLRWPTLAHWHQVPGPTNKFACRKFGGCQFVSICSGRASPREYTLATNKLIEEHERKKKMSNLFMQSIGANGGAVAAPPAMPINSPVPPPAPQPALAQNPLLAQMFYTVLQDGGQPVEKSGAEIMAIYNADTAANRAQRPVYDGKEWSTITKVFAALLAPPALPATPRAVPPWARADCIACQGSGFASTGQPCRICDSLQMKEGKAVSGHFAITTSGDGTMTWAPNPATFAPVPATVVAPSAPAAPTATVPIPAAAPEPVEAKPKRTRSKKKDEAEAPAAEEAPADAGTPATVAAPNALGLSKGAGRPSKTFTLLVNAQSNHEAVDAALILERLGAILAQRQGAASYYALNAWPRRDAIASAVPEILEELKGKIVAANNDSPDMKALVQGLRAHASHIIEGTR